MGYWRDRARNIITAAWRDAKAQNIRGRAVRKFINKHYEGYGHPRSKYPYRVWLEELDKVMYKELNGCSQLVLTLGVTDDDEGRAAG